MKFKTSLFATALLGSFLVFTPISSFAKTAMQQEKEGWDAYNKRDYNKAIRLWKPLAQKGDVYLQYQLGLMYE